LIVEDNTAEGRGVGNAGVEIVVSVLIIMLGTVAAWDSARIGAGWGSDGPQSGYVPFWIGMILIAASLVNLFQVARGREAGAQFASFAQLRLVATILAPATVYVVAIPFLGIYASSAILVAFFMVRLGEFRWWVAIASGLAVAVVTFVTFEIWFLVSMPKGPIEELLGL
jgi:putative tricarboxylic transport membrane protein